MSSWNLQRLRHFVAVAEAPSLSEAARRLGISQPALTISVRKLEQEVGMSLFDRELGFDLTALGREFLQRTKGALLSMDDLGHELDLLKAGHLGSLRVGCGPTVADGLMGPALAELFRVHPDLTVTVEVGGFETMPPLLRARKLDLVVVEYTLVEQAEDLEIEALPPQEVILFCRSGHPLAGKAQVSTEEFFRYPAIATSLPPWAVAWLKANRPPWAKQSGLNLECSHNALLKTVVMGSDAVSGAPRLVIQDELDSGKLVRVDLVAEPMVNRSGVVYLRGRSLSPAALQLVAALKRVGGA